MQSSVLEGKRQLGGGATLCSVGGTGGDPEDEYLSS